MIALSLRPFQKRWQTLSFPSTLYLFPILELLLQDIPGQLHSDLRLGLQEALVNAAKHGNCLDVRKSVQVQFSKQSHSYQWVIADEGQGFSPPETCSLPCHEEALPDRHQECGRGIYILYQVFDEVAWSRDGTELHLRKKAV